MAVVVAAQLLADIVGLPQGLPTDVENDANTATQGDFNVFVPPAAGNGGFLTCSPELAATLQSLVNGPCTITISQGAGTLNTPVSQ